MSALVAIGVNYRSAPIELRERTAFAPDDIAAALADAKARLPLREVVLLSTCNRTELYAVVEHVEQFERDAVIRILTQQADDADVHDSHEYFYELTGHEAVEHLLGVCASLDSMVVGEVEILGQVKQAYRIALEAGATGKMTNNVFQHAFSVAKRVHTETKITQGRVSVSSIAVEFVRTVFSDLQEKTVMIVGAGETAELTLRSLVEKGVRDVFILNRSLENAQRLASLHGGKASQLEFLPDFLPKADIVITSSGASHCLIEKPVLAAAMKERHRKPMLLVDIAVPRDISPDVDELRDVYLYHIDDLQRVADQNLEKRQAAVEGARRIVAQGVADLAPVFDTPAVGELLRDFDIQVRQIAGTALSKSLAKERMANLPPECRTEIEALVHSVTKKLLAQPRSAIKNASKNGQWDAYAGVVRDLFGMRHEQDPPPAKDETH